MQFQNLLTVLDKPKHAQSALDLTMALQERNDATVELLSFCWNPLIGERTALAAEERRMIKSKTIKQRKDWLRALMAGRQLNDAAITSKAVWTDEIATWVTDYAGEQKADLIIKSSHPSQTLLHTPLDWELLRKSPVPVLLTNAKKPSKKGKQKTKIVLAAIDLRHQDKRHQRLNERVVAAANDYATLIGAKLACVSAIEVSTVLKDLDVIDPKRVQRRLLAQNKDALQKLLAPYDIPKSRQHFPIGKAGLAVNQIARKLGAELLVVGTNSKRLSSRLGLGNSAERILSRAATDVLAVTPS
ncbi:MAG: universal stress protein [Pseudomonadales bacterium]